MNEYELNKDETEYAIDVFSLIKDLWKGFKSIGWTIIIFAVIAAGINCGIAYRNYSPSYTAAASFSVNLEESSDGSIYEDSLRAAQMSKTFPYIIDSGALKNVIAGDLGRVNITETITAENVENTNLFTIKVASGDARQAYQVLQSVIKNYPAVADTVVGSTKLDILDETGIPDKPDNTVNYSKRIEIGALIGAGLGLLAILVFALTRNTIHKIEDIEKITNIKHLGSLPEVTLKKRGSGQDRIITLQNEKLPFSYREEILKIRARIEKITNQKGVKTILVTSAIPGEGKSTFAYNLALALAEEGKKTILTDCDFRRPTLHKLLSVPSETIGIEEVLDGKAKLKEALKYYDKQGIYALVCNQPIKNSAEIIDTANMSKLLEEMKNIAEYIILDTAPSAILSDTCDLAKLAEGAIFIVKQDYSKKDQVLEGLEHISEGSDIKMIGCVLNSVKSGIAGYGYGYGYGYGHYGKYGRYGYGDHHNNRKRDKGELITEK